MKKNIKKIFLLLSIILLIFIIVVAFKILIFRRYAITNIRVNDNKLTFDSDMKRENGEYISVEGEKNRRANIVSEITLFVNNKKMLLNDKMYEKNLRYYISVEDIVKNGQVILDGNKILSKKNKNYIDLSNKMICTRNKTLAFRGEVLDIGNKVYISINDLKELLNLKDDWYKDKKSICFFDEKEKNIQSTYKVENGKAALIRLEDVSAGRFFAKDSNIEKMKYLGDYFEDNNIVFHIAWIPRYVNPKENIDNDLLKNNSFENVHFINMLDHLINRGAIIGLHGYTHQHDNEVSGVGVELKWNVNSEKKDVINIVEESLKTAKTLNIPVGFFESPHYKADRSQQKIIENYFPIMFEPYAGYWNLNPLISLSNKSTLYVPAPLGYVKDEGQAVSEKIINCSDYMLTAFFIHPYKFLGSIKNQSDSLDDEETYNFSKESPILKILNALKERGCKTITVDELNKQVK